MKFQQYTGVNPDGDSIIVTDPNGNIYKFKDVEASFSIPDEPNTRYNTSAYYLSEIITSNGEKVKFEYKLLKQLITENRWETQFPDYSSGNGADQQAGYYPLSPVLFEESYVIFDAIGIRDISSKALRSNYTKLRSYTLYKPVYLDKITFPNGEISFVKTPRSDTYGVKLDQMVIKNKMNQTIRTFSFAYDYFDANTQPYGYDVTTAVTNVSTSVSFNYPENYLKKRLKLVSFSESAGTGKNETYGFVYNETYPLPYKTSFAQDFWGYYNGQTTNKTLLPSYTLYSSVFGLTSDFQSGVASTVLTANRNVNTLYNQSGMLKEITFPSKGKTSYQYESNDCVNSFASTKSIEKKYIAATDIGYGLGRTVFTFTEQRKVNVSVTLARGIGSLTTGTTSSPFLGSGYGDGVNDWYAIIEKLDGNRWVFFDNKYFWGSDKITSSNQSYNLDDQTFAPGTYRLTASFPDKYAQYGNVAGSWSYICLTYDTTIVSKNNLVGGLRIKSITHSDNITSQPPIIKNYKYSNGILMSAPRFVSGYFCKNPDHDISLYIGNYTKTDAYKVSVSANPTIAFTYSANGNLVGYGNVEEKYSVGETGKINYFYDVSPDILSTFANIMPDIPYTSKLTNGFLLLKEIYDSNNTLLEYDRFQSVIVNSKVYWGLILDPRFFYYQTDAVVDLCDIANQNYFYFYPIIQGKVLLKQEDTEDYRQGAIPPVQRKTEYEYNAYSLPVSKKIDDSASGKVTETYKYVPEKAAEAGGVYLQMKSKNIISPLIETLTDHNGAVVKQVTNYFQPYYSNIFTPSSFQVQFGSGTLETRIAYDK